MIKKLRVRIILSAILAFFLVIIFISVLVNVVNYRIVTSHADDTLISIREFDHYVDEQTCYGPIQHGWKRPTLITNVSFCRRACVHT